MKVASYTLVPITTRIQYVLSSVQALVTVATLFCQAVTIKATGMSSVMISVEDIFFCFFEPELDFSTSLLLSFLH